MKLFRWFCAIVLIVAFLQSHKPPPPSVDIDTDAMLVACSAISLTTAKHRIKAEQLVDNSIDILAQRQHVTYGIARWHLRKLFRDYGDKGVLNECLDRGLIVDFKKMTRGTDFGQC